MAFLEVKEIGMRLRQFRMNAGLTQEQLAVKINVTFQQIQKYESGETRLSTDKLQRVAEALNMSVCSFFDNKEDVELILSETEKQLVDLYRNIKDFNGRDALITVLQALKKK